MLGSDEEKTATTPVYRVARSVKYGEEAIIVVGGEEVTIRVKSCRGRNRFRISVSSHGSDLKVVSRKSD